MVTVITLGDVSRKFYTKLNLLSKRAIDEPDIQDELQQKIVDKESVLLSILEVLATLAQSKKAAASKTVHTALHRATVSGVAAAEVLTEDTADTHIAKRVAAILAKPEPPLSMDVLATAAVSEKIAPPQEKDEDSDDVPLMKMQRKRRKKTKQHHEPAKKTKQQAVPATKQNDLPDGTPVGIIFEVGFMPRVVTLRQVHGLMVPHQYVLLTKNTQGEERLRLWTKNGVAWRVFLASDDADSRTQTLLRRIKNNPEIPLPRIAASCTLENGLLTKDCIVSFRQNLEARKDCRLHGTGKVIWSTYLSEAQQADPDFECDMSSSVVQLLPRT